MLCYVMLCYVMLCYVMLCYVILYYIILTMIGYMTNPELTIYPCGLVAQWIEIAFSTAQVDSTLRGSQISLSNYCFRLRSVLHYISSIWTSCDKENLGRVFKLQKRQKG